MPAQKKKRPAPPAVNPYGDHPVSDFLVAANGSMGEYMPFGGVLDRAGLGVNKLLGIGPQSLKEIATQREKDQLRSVPGAVTGAGIGMASNALLPVEALLANMAQGAVEGGTSDPEIPFSPSGAALGTGMSMVPLLKFLKLDPRGIPPESFVRTLPAVTKELPGLLDIRDMILKQEGRSPGIMSTVKQKLSTLNIPGLSQLKKLTRKEPFQNFYDTSGHLMAEAEKRMPGKGYNFSPYGTPEDYARDLKNVQGLTWGEFAAANTPEAIPHEGIHAATAAAARKHPNISRFDIENAMQNRIIDKYTDVFHGLKKLILDVNGYRPEALKAELIPFLHGVLTQPKERESMIQHVFGNDKKAYQAWATEAKRAYRDTVKWAKDATPDEIKELVKKGVPDWFFDY